MLPLDQLQKVVDAADLPWRNVFRLCLESGCRVGEAMYATGNCFMAVSDGRCAFVIEPHTLPDGSEWLPKRPSSVRKLVVPAGYSQYSVRGSRLAFFDEDTVTRTRYRWFWKKALKAAGLRPDEATTHDLRRARIVQSLASGADPWTVARCVGHSSLATTVTYLRSVPLLMELPPIEAQAGTNVAAEQWRNVFTPNHW
jgi:integrase